MAAKKTPPPQFGNDFERYIVFLTNGAQPALIAPERFAEALGIDMKTLASKARVHIDTLKRSPNAENIQFFLLESIRALHAASEAMGSIDRANAWFAGAKDESFGLQPIEVVAQGQAEALIARVQELG